jgi:hypothetical protein
VTRTVYVAAGGGGDALAAYALHAASRSSDRPVIATFAWDRILIDPVPGPRSHHEFEQLDAVDDLNWAITAATRPLPPAGSTLPRLAAEVDATLVLLDPSQGALGLQAQLRSLVATLDGGRVVVVDVGGDVLAAGLEPSLRSPLADALALAGCADLPVPVSVRVAGAGLDGELAPSTVLGYVHALEGSQSYRLSAEDMAVVMPVLDWHPSEATALIAAGALGLRGTVEIRGDGHLVELTDDSPNVYDVDHGGALRHSGPATALARTTSLAEAEDAVRAVCGTSELDYERRAAARRRAAAHLADVDLIAALDQYSVAVQHRAVDYLTIRRLAEVLDLPTFDGAELRARLSNLQPEQYVPPLWQVRRGTAPLRR